jgi:glutaredoxin
MAITHVNGKDVGHVMLYALSTCVWCGKTRKLLDELGVAYDFEYVDLLQGEEKKSAIQKVMVWNPACSFPTLIIKDKKCIVGFKEDDIRQALKK